MTYTEDDTFKALRKVPFLTAWNSIGLQDGAEEKRQLEKLDKISDDEGPASSEWGNLFDGWTWKDYKQECRKLYNRKYK